MAAITAEEIQAAFGKWEAATQQKFQKALAGALSGSGADAGPLRAVLGPAIVPTPVLPSQTTTSGPVSSAGSATPLDPTPQASPLDASSLGRSMGDAMGESFRPVLDRLERLFLAAVPKPAAKPTKDEEEIKKPKIEEGIVSGLGAAFGKLGVAFAAPTGTGTAAGLFAAAGEATPGATGAAGFALSGLAKFGGALLGSVLMIRQFAGSLHETDKAFAEVSGSMAQVMAERQILDIQLSQQRGERRAASARERELAIAGFERAFAPIEDAADKLKNIIVTGWARIGTVLSNLAQGRPWNENLLGPEQPPGLDVGRMWLDHTTDYVRWLQDFGLPGGMGPPAPGGP